MKPRPAPEERGMPKQTFFNLPEEKRRLLLDTAIQEFAENDYKNASISNLVNRAGIAKGSFYQYFEDKRELYFYLLQLAAEEKKAFLSNSQPPDPSMGLFDYLCWLMDQGARFEMSSPGLAQVAYRALFSDRPFGDAPFEQVRQAAHAFYGAMVDLGRAQGSIDPGIDRDLAIFLFSAIFNEFGRYLIERLNIDPQALARGEVSYQELPIGDLTNQIIEILARGLAPQAPK
jgi:TetR/AcrR family transcriptional regulator